MAKKSEQQKQATDDGLQATGQTEAETQETEAQSPKPDSLECEVTIGSINEAGKTYVIGQRILLSRERAESRAKAGTVKILR